MQTPEQADQRAGTLYGLAAYSLWGAFPLYFHALLPAGPWEVLAHRILWTMLVCVAALLVLRQAGPLLRMLRSPRRCGLIATAAVLIATNWTLYVLAVQTDRTTEAALGYFLNPLVTVALGVVLLKESLRRLQWIAVGVGGIACLYLAGAYGRPPLIGLSLALTFGTYGLIKKRVGGSMSALQSLSSETLVLTPLALVLVVVATRNGTSTFTSQGSGHTALLVLSGVLTAVPLLLFAAAARRIPLVTIGLLQFLTPILQLLCAVLLLDEHMSASRWVGFAIVWIALLLLTIDSLHAGARSRRAARSASAAATAG